MDYFFDLETPENFALKIVGIKSMKLYADETMLSSEDQISIYLRFEWLDDDGLIISEKLYCATIQIIIFV